MRIMIKGGVWKNTEDEILKAAVMKYGLNQWARISSLLVRKSAKQCKARWYEWLDPSIKKTEWTREEDEKLLHLAKLMPTQWRTIAPIVGRTPAQCLERYEKLLDMAISKDERYDPADDPRRLRPGEIDPNPESKPARPDPVDMDEDEKEMLSEARARLANTRGKKAKRKAREKQLEEARRLAALQKKRELKAAGIQDRGRRRIRGIDYNAEVAFEKKPQAGFFDTAEEEQVSRQISSDFRPVTIEELEGKRRKDIEEALVKRDIKKQKLLEDHDAPGAVAKAGALNDVPLLPRRTKMMLPAPQVSEVELQQIARMQAQGGMVEGLEEGPGGDATRQLLGQYQTPAMMPTPMRTPRTAAGQDKVMLEAQNLARMQNLQTPLVGGDNPELHPSDFSGATPRTQAPGTANPYAATPLTGPTPVRRAIAGVPSTPSAAVGATPLHTGMTPAPGMIPGATPMRTPMRDELGLNDSSSLVPADSKQAERARQIMMRNELKAGLSQLPAPENEYQVVVPELPADEDRGGEAMEEDAADVKARLAREEEARREAEEKKKSQVLQRHLPRPVSTDRVAAVVKAVQQQQEQGAGLREQAEALLAAELLKLVQHDNGKYPQKEDKKEKKDKKGKREKAGAVPVVELEEVAPEHLKEAAEMLAKETAYVRAYMRHTNVPTEEYAETWNTVRKDLIYLPSQQAYGRAASATNSERLESVRKEHEVARAAMEKEAARAKKVDDKVKVVLGGLISRSTALASSTASLHEELQKARVDNTSYKALQEQEQRAAPQRLEAARELLERQRQREAELQERYKLLLQQQQDLQEALRAAPVPAQ